MQITFTFIVKGDYLVHVSHNIVATLSPTGLLRTLAKIRVQSMLMYLSRNYIINNIIE